MNNSKTNKATITRGLETSNEFGKISKIEFSNKSKIYISKKGWSLITLKGKPIRLPYNEINVAIQETIKQGYVAKENNKKG